MSDSSVPVPTFGPNGFVAPDESAVLNGVQADQNAAFGGGLNPSLSTPQGQLATTQSASYMAAIELMLAVMNGVDPATAAGRMQDAIGRIYFQARNPAEPTVVQALCTGAALTIIAVGAMAQATDGNLYICTSGGQIPVGGSITLTFACLLPGPIACPANTLNVIYQSVGGWDSINNVTDGVLGANVEDRQAFEERRAQSVAANSQGPAGAIQGAVRAVPGVTDAYTIENPLGTAQTIGGVSIAANSLYCCTSGGDPQAVANAIFSKKGPGANYTGNTTKTVVDSNPAYVNPPSYAVTFQTAAPLPIFFAVTLLNSTGLPSDYQSQVQNAIVLAFAGGDGRARATIGSTLLALRYVRAVEALGPWAAVETLTIGTAAAPTGNNVVVPIDHQPTTAAANIGVSHT